MLEVKWPYPTMDDWQKDALQFHKFLILYCGRQVGKSEVMAKKIAEYLLNNPKHKLLIVSGKEAQASGLYLKVIDYISGSHPKMLGKKKDTLRTQLKLKNGAQLITEPVGVDGGSARRHTIHGLIIEEMQLIPEEAFAALTPMLLTTNGFIWMLGTAWSTEGYVYDRLSDPDFKVIRVNAEEVAEQRPEPNRTFMLAHLERERRRLSTAWYAQEYLAIPSENVRQIFPDKLIAKVMTASRPGTIEANKEYICGVDPAGLGQDEGSISIFDDQDNMFIQVEHEVTKKLYTTQTTKRIVELEKLYNFKKIYVDDGGVGFGVFSELLNSDETKYKTVPLNNSARPLDFKDEKRKKILYEDMIFNLLTMMERGEIKLLTDSEIRESLKSYKFEYHEKTKKLIITSNYNHPVQSIMRAAFHKQQKDLKLRIYSIKT